MTNPAAPFPTTTTDLALWLLAEWLYQEFSTLTQQIGAIMAEVRIEQSHIENVATAVEAVATAVSALSVPLPPADETALNQAVTDLQTALSTAQGGATPAAPAG